eukprot:5429335-Amphidinium_carterae.2
MNGCGSATPVVSTMRWVNARSSNHRKGCMNKTYGTHQKAGLENTHCTRACSCTLGILHELVNKSSDNMQASIVCILLSEFCQKSG